MSDTTASLRRKIEGARDLRAVVSTMKALAAASVGQYEKSVRALDDYYRTVQLGLSVCFRSNVPARSKVGGIKPMATRKKDADMTGAIVFGSDQGLVGQFNDVVADYTVQTLAALPGKKKVWAVGERVHDRLAFTGVPLAGLFTVPLSVKAITPLVGNVLLQLLVREQVDGDVQWRKEGKNEVTQLYLFYNNSRAAAVYVPVHQRLLPLDATWRRDLANLSWPTKNLPEVMGSSPATLQALIREYLFVSLFRACAESLASENASRLAAMERAEKNIDQLSADLHQTFYRLRQSTIDEELFDVISGMEALAGAEQARHPADRGMDD